MTHQSLAPWRVLMVGVVLVAAPVLAGFSGTDVFVAMAGRQAGVHPSNWYTTLWIFNPGAEAATARVHFLERGTSNPSPPWVDVLVGPGDTEKLENVVDALFHLQKFGALRVTCATQGLVVTARVYSNAEGPGEADSVGQDFVGVPAAFAIGLNEKSRILGAHQTLPAGDSECRYNFGFVETTGHSATVRVTAYDGDNAFQGSKDFNVLAWSQRQVAFRDHFPGVSTRNTRLDIEVIAGQGEVIGYGSMITNGAQDPTTFEMEYPAAVLAENAVPGITGVIAGGGLTGGGTSGTVTLDVGAGDGIVVAADAVSIANLGVTTAKLGDNAVTGSKIADGAVSPAKIDTSGAAAGQVLKAGSPAQWSDDGLKLPFSGSVSSVDTALAVTNGNRVAIQGASTAAIGVRGVAGGTTADPSEGPVGVMGMSATGAGVVGVAGSFTAVVGNSTGGLGVYGKSTGSHGVMGESVSAAGVRGHSGPAYTGFLPTGQAGVIGTSRDDVGVLGVSHEEEGLWGITDRYARAGVRGRNAVTGAEAFLGLDNRGLVAKTPAGPWAGEFINEVPGTGAGVKATGSNNGAADLILGANNSADDDGLIFSDTSYSGSDIGLMSMDRVWVDLDDDDNSSGSFFQVRSGADTEIFKVEEDGDVRVPDLASSPTRAVCANSDGYLVVCPAAPSDGRLKTNVVGLSESVDAIAALAALRGVRFDWDPANERAAELGTRRQIGMIAQEVEAVLPELVDRDGDGYLSLDYAKLTAFLVEVAKAQQSEIRTLAARVRALEAQPGPATGR